MAATIKQKGEEMITLKKLEEEANKQLVGIKIIAIIGMIIWFIFWIQAVVGSISMAISYDPIEGLSMFLTLTLLFGGLISINIFGLVGIIKRRPSAIPLCRAILWINAGLIWLIMLWPRLNKPLLKWYLNYGSIDIKEAEKEIVKQYPGGKNY